MIKKIVLIITIVLVGGLGVFLWNVNQTEKEETARYEAWNEERRPLVVEKKKVEQQLDNLQDSYEADKLPRGTTQLLFTDLNEQIYTVCYPIMKEYEYTGVLVVSPEKFPGKENCMSELQFKELIKEGWTICVEWNDEILKNKWWNSLKRSLKELDMEPGNVIYFPAGSYDVKYDSIAQQRGFSIIVTEKSEEEDPLQRQNESGLWHIGAIGFMTQQPKTWLQQAVAQDANITYLISFQQESQLYNGESFKGMMNVFAEYCANEELMVSSVDEAREHYIARTEGVDPAVEAKYQQEKADLDAKLADIEAKLQEVDAKYE